MTKCDFFGEWDGYDVLSPEGSDPDPVLILCPWLFLLIHCLSRNQDQGLCQR